MELWAPTWPQLARVWPIVYGLVKRVCDRPEVDYDPREVLLRCAQPDWDCFIGIKDGAIAAVVITQMQDPPGEGKRMAIPIVAGDGLDEIIELGRRVEEIGRRNGAVKAVGGGRRGWARAAGYTIIGEEEGGGLVMERRL